MPDVAADPPEESEEEEECQSALDRGIGNAKGPVRFGVQVEVECCCCEGWDRQLHQARYEAPHWHSRLRTAAEEGISGAI